MTKMRRADKQISVEAAWTAAKQCVYGVLAMVAEGGTPYAVPVNFVCDGDAIYFHSAMEGRKAECLRKNPNICLTCVSDAQAVQERFTMQYTSAVIFGTVTEVTDKEKKCEALRMLCRRHAPDYLKKAEEVIAGGSERTAVWRVTVEEISGKSGH
jgi:nitroimidazol reductase NimA-like FMN-containing flavoprotein (pyridoxamine 5'-phosphate oxidase superfamily)